MFKQPANALHSIKSLAFQQVPISLATTYKGILFDERVNPIRVGADQVVFSAPRQQVCQTMHDPLHLHSRALPESVLASLQSLNPLTGEMVLTNFRFSGSLWRDRYEQRVQPAIPIPAMVTIDQRIYQASLVDLSMHGAGVSIYFNDMPLADPPLKESVDINFQINSETRLSMRSVVAYKRKIGMSLLHLGLHLFPSPYQETWLDGYITRRKIEIMSELQQEMRSRVETPRVENRLR